MHNDYEFGTIIYGASDYRDFSQNQKLTLNDQVIFLEQSINPDGVKCYLVLLNDSNHTKLYLPSVYFQDSPSPETVATKVYFDWIERHQDLGAWVYDTDIFEFDSIVGEHYYVIRKKGTLEALCKIYVGKMTERFNE